MGCCRGTFSWELLTKEDIPEDDKPDLRLAELILIQAAPTTSATRTQQFLQKERMQSAWERLKAEVGNLYPNLEKELGFPNAQHYDDFELL